MKTNNLIAIVGPLPPPAGGMAQQTDQQIKLIFQKGYEVRVIQTNAPYVPAFIANLTGFRALCRLVQYLLTLLYKLRGVSTVHVMANSGWSWFLFAVPPIVIGRLFGARVVVNYRGGEAETFFKKSWKRVRPILSLAHQIVVPSGYLQGVFNAYGFATVVIPNTLDTTLFCSADHKPEKSVKTIVVARNLEKIYDIDMAISAFKRLATHCQNVELRIAGSGSEEISLRQKVQAEGLVEKVIFLGRLSREHMAVLYQKADLLLNTSTVDNSPNALIEAMACGVPIVSSAVGGIPFLVKHREQAILIDNHSPECFAEAMHAILTNNDLAHDLIQAGFKKSQEFEKTRVMRQWDAIYAENFDSKNALANTNKQRSIRLFSRVRTWFDSSYTQLTASLIFPMHEQLKKHTTVQVAKAMECRQWWRVEAVQAYQDKELRDFLSHIYQHVPYYQKLFDAHDFNPKQVKSLKDLAKLPFLTKEIIRKNTEVLKADNAVGLSQFNTGGSSGQPLIFYIGRERVSHDVAAKWRATRWWDVDIGDKEIVLWGSPIELGKQDRIKQIRDYFLRTELISAFNLNQQTKKEILKKIISCRPPMLFGYPSVYFLLASFAEEQGMDMQNCGIKAIFVTSERLYDYQREKIEQIFNARVANGYGGRDAGFIAHECPAGKMHITSDDIVVEIVDHQGVPLPAGASGEIVVTHLRTSDFPFVRYKTGDIGTLACDVCRCGRGLPVLERIEGRTTDFIVASDGTQMHGLSLIYHVRDVPGVKNFKVVQESLQHTNLFLEVDGEFKNESKTEIVSNFKKRLGVDVDVDVLIQDKIASENSGKFRYVVSKVGS